MTQEEMIDEYFATEWAMQPETVWEIFYATRPGEFHYLEQVSDSEAVAMQAAYRHSEQLKPPVEIFVREYLVLDDGSWSTQSEITIYPNGELSMSEAFPKQEVVEGHPSQDTTDRWPLDRILREKYGCKIEYRPRRLEAIWSHPKHGFRSASAMAALLGIKKLRGGLDK